MASSLKLADPSELAGHWQVVLSSENEPADAQALQDKPSNICTLELQVKQTLGEGADCLSEWLGGPVTGWFPEPDGIAITGAEGSKIIFFSRQPDGSHTSHLNSGMRVTLTRDTH